VRLQALLDDYRLSPKEAANVIAQISSEVLNFNGYLNNYGNSSKNLRVAPNDLADGECEVGINTQKASLLIWRA
jgi:hypothetical protein